MGSRIGLGLGLWPGGRGSPAFLALMAVLPWVTRWRMSSTADATGNGHGLTLTGAPPQTAVGAVANDADACTKFDGATQRADFADAADLRFAAGDSFTLHFLAKPSAITGFTEIIQKGRTSATSQGNWVARNNAGVLEFYNFTTGPTLNLWTSTSAGIFVPGAWTQGVIVWQPGNVPTVYANGAAITGSVTSGSFANTGFLGTTDSGQIAAEESTSKFAGWVDEVAVGRFLASAGTVSALYAAAAKSQVTATVTAVANKARFVFTKATASFNGLGDFSAFKVNASGGGLVSPTAASSVSGTTVDFTYASSVVSTNAWQVNDEPPASAISFGPTFYLKAPMSGTAA